MNMDSLISIVNKLHDIFNVTGASSIMLPQIVVVGSQSSGKSSVLESLIGRDFLPRGTGIVTRCPLILQLIYTQKEFLPTSVKDMALDEWGTFLHTGEKIFTDFQEIRKEIEIETERKSGSNKGISSEAINLKIFSPNVINLTLVDLPGITKVPVGDQPKDIEMQVRQLILKYISNPNAIILAVTAANTDFSTSESIKLARECDPEGKRTIAVITKLDLMDAGTDATDVLCGRMIPVRLGIIGVVNRSQQDIIDDKDIKSAIKDEALYLQKFYPTLASRNGTEFLRKRLNKLLIDHIRDCLPNLKTRVNKMIAHYQALIHSYGNNITDPNRLLLQIITKFTSSYCAALEGTARNIETSELSGGARICYIFHEVFGCTLKNINPLNGLTSWDILTAIRNATGTRPAFFVPEIAFELLVKRQIRRLEQPSLRCVELVYEEMQRIVRHCGAEIQQEILRFPKLHEKIMDVVNQLLQDRLPATNTMVENLIAIELSYVNTKHPDFYNHCSSYYSNEKSIIFKKQSTNAFTEAPICFNTTPEMKPKLEEGISESFNSLCENMENSTKAVMIAERANEVIVDGDIDDYASSLENQNWFERLSKSLMHNIGDQLNNDGHITSQAINPPSSPDNLHTVETYNYARNLSATERKECKIIEHLICSYFMIVKKNIQDAVPKAIMHFLVNYVKDSLQSELVTHLYKPEYLTSLLQESESITNGRKEAMEMLQTLQKSSDIIGEIREISL